MSDKWLEVKTYESAPLDPEVALIDTLEDSRRDIISSGSVKDEVPREPALRILITLKPGRCSRPAVLQLMSRLVPLREISFGRPCPPEVGLEVNVWRDVPDVTEPLLKALDADEAVESYQKIEEGA